MPRGPLHAAAEKGDLAAVRSLLLQDKSRLEDLTQGYNETPLHRAAESGHAEVVQELLAAKADVNARRRGGYTALHLAQSAAVAQVLLASGIDRDIRARNGQTAAEYCTGGQRVRAHIQDHAERHAAAPMAQPEAEPAPAREPVRASSTH